MGLGFSKWQSEDLVRRSKRLMVQKGYAYYENRRLGIVPVEAVEEVLGLNLGSLKGQELHA